MPWRWWFRAHRADPSRTLGARRAEAVIGRLDHLADDLRESITRLEVLANQEQDR